MYIIIWRHRSSREAAFIQTDTWGAIELFGSKEDAQASIDEMLENQGPRDSHYFDPKIYEEA